MAKVTLETLKKIDAMGLEGMNVLHGFYKSIFDMVANQQDWKAPISRVIHKDALSVEPEVIRHAVVFFTGNSDCKVEEFETYYLRVTSAGYRAGPCGG